MLGVLSLAGLLLSPAAGGWITDAMAELPEGSKERAAIKEYSERYLHVEPVLYQEQALSYDARKGHVVADEIGPPIETFKVIQGRSLIPLRARPFSELVDAPLPRRLKPDIPTNYDEEAVGAWVKAYNEQLMRGLGIDLILAEQGGSR